MKVRNVYEFDSMEFDVSQIVTEFPDDITKIEKGIVTMNGQNIKCELGYKKITNPDGFTREEFKAITNREFPREIEDYTFAYDVKTKKLVYWYSGVGNYSASKGSTSKPKDVKVLTTITNFGKPLIKLQTI